MSFRHSTHRSAILSALALLSVVASSGSTDPRKSTPTANRIQDLDWATQDQSNLRCNITNFGVIGSTPGAGAPYGNEPSAMWPAFSGVEYLWSAGLWIGALKNGTPAVSTAAYALEFRPGRTAVDVMREAKENDPGGMRLPSSLADDDGDGKIDEDPLDGYDNDNDLQVDEDFAAISDQMLTARFNDMDPDIKTFHPEHEPLGLEIVQNTMAWVPQLNENFIAFDYKIINAGVDTLINAYVGFFTDFDIGRRSRGTPGIDDRSGFWEGLAQPAEGPLQDIPVSLGYMLDNDGDNGEANGVIGIVFLNVDDPHVVETGPVKLHNYRAFTGFAPFEFGGDPGNDMERYETLSGTAPFSLPPPNPAANRTPSSTPAGDYRNLVSVGPFAMLAPGDTVCISFAMVIGDGFDGLLHSAAQAQILYNGLWFDCDNDPQTGVDGKECNVHWISDVPTPVALQEFAASVEDEGVRLRWQLDHGTLGDLRRVELQRSTARSGPFHSLETGLVPAQNMSFLDRLAEPGQLYWYRLALDKQDGSRELTRSISIQVQDQPFSRPELFVRVADPSAPVEVRYRLAEASNQVSLSIYDIGGRLVRTLDRNPHQPGEYLRSWDRLDQNRRVVSPGVYVVNLRTSGTSLSRKVVLVH